MIHKQQETQEMTSYIGAASLAAKVCLFVHANQQLKPGLIFSEN